MSDHTKGEDSPSDNKNSYTFAQNKVMPTRIHSSLMLQAILLNCRSGFYVLEDKDSPKGSRMVSKEEYSLTMLGFASYIAEKSPALFNAIPVYLQYASMELTPDAVIELFGPTNVITSSEVRNYRDVYHKQTIVLSEDFTIELTYYYNAPVGARVIYREKTKCVMEIKSIIQLADLIREYSGEVVVMGI